MVRWRAILRALLHVIPDIPCRGVPVLLQEEEVAVAVVAADIIPLPLQPQLQPQ